MSAPAPLPRSPRRSPSFGSRFGMWIIAGLAVVALGFALPLLFSGTSVTVTPKQAVVSVHTTLKAFKVAQAGELSFQVMAIEKSGSQTVAATGQENVSVRASGKLVIYNDYSSASQRLIRNTRFESSAGKIYRIDQSIVVPGKVKNTPGSIEAVVYADEPGESYNSDLTDFTIPGFKGSPQYSKFYARSKTPFEGGFVGTRLSVDPAVLAKTREDIRAKLKDELVAAAAAQKPEGYELFNEALFVDYTSLPNGESGGAVLVEEKGTLHGILFSADDLARAIALATASSPAEGAFLTLGNDSTLVLAMSSADQFEPWAKESFSFSLNGSAHLIALFSPEQLRGDLAGKTKGALPTVLSGYPGIAKAEVVMRPFWKQTFPQDPEKIKLSTSLGK